VKDEVTASSDRRVQLHRTYSERLVGVSEEVLASARKLPVVLKSGEAGDPVLLDERTLERLLRAALVSVGGHERVLWRHRGAETLVHLDRTRVRVIDGYVLVGITLENSETGEQELTVPLALGTETRLAGMLAVTERRPRGHRVLAETWGEGVIACAWRAVLEVADVMAALRGSDEHSQPLRAGALVAGRGELAVVPQAKHSYESAATRCRDKPG
jgi:hypothetical protein